MFFPCRRFSWRQPPGTICEGEPCAPPSHSIALLAGLGCCCWQAKLPMVVKRSSSLFVSARTAPDGCYYSSIGFDLAAGPCHPVRRPSRPLQMAAKTNTTPRRQNAAIRSSGIPFCSDGLRSCKALCTPATITPRQRSSTLLPQAAGCRSDRRPAEKLPS